MVEQKIPTPTIDKYIGCGCYQVLIVLATEFVTFVNAFNMAMMVFGKVEPQWICRDWETERNSSNLTDAEFYTCPRLAKNPCQNFTYMSDFISVAYDFGLICGKIKIIYLSMSIQMIGVLVASPVFGQLSDWFGRKWVLFISTALLLSTGAASAASPNITIFIIFRFFIGIFSGGSITTSYVYFVENLIAKHRFWVTAVGSWSVPFAFMALFAWLTGNWRDFSIIGNLIGIPGLIMLCFLKESPRWLIQKGKSKEAKKSLAMVVTINRTKISEKDQMDVLLDNIDKERKNSITFKKRYSFWHLFSTKRLAIDTSVLSFCYLALSIVSGGVVFDSSNLKGNRYILFFVLNVARYIIAFAAALIDMLIKKCGRKTVFLVGFAIVGACCIAVTVLKIIGFSGSMSVTYLAITAGIITAPIWNGLLTLSSETFPTPIRNVGIGFTSVFNRLGGVLMPQILYMAHFWNPAPYVIFSALSILACLSNFFFINETKGRIMPEKMPYKVQKETKVKLERTASDKSATMRSNSFSMYHFNELKDKSTH